MPGFKGGRTRSGTGKKTSVVEPHLDRRHGLQIVGHFRDVLDEK
jgi:hypothetical protein